MKKILVFGYFGYVTDKLDGQTVKTRAIYELLNERVDAKVRYADTQAFRSSSLAILRFFRDLFWCTTLVWLPAHNNLRHFFRPLRILSKISKFAIIYIVIGGWLSEILKQLPYHRKYLAEIKAILVENETTVKELLDMYGYQNLNIIPNFRFSTPRFEAKSNREKLKLVFMARIDMNKGLETIEQLSRHNYLNFTVDFYGPINPEHKDYFERLIANNDNLAFKGQLQPLEINNVLVSYDAMILPTRYYTEGLPGSIVDAYMAGLPVLVSRWKHASEFVENGQTGFVADFDNPVAELANAIRLLTLDRSLLTQMKRRVVKEAEKYTSETAKIILYKYI